MIRLSLNTVHFRTMMELSPDAARFLPLVKSIASQLQRELGSDLDPDAFMDSGLDGLKEGFAQFRSRQGLTLRTYLIYRIRAAIYARLSGYKWETERARRRYLFLKKSNELQLNFHLSAEGAMKRSIQAEEEEVLHLLGLLTIVALLAGNEACEVELKNSIQDLEPSQQDFIRFHYDQDLDLEAVSQKIGFSPAAGFRFHLEVLKTLAANLSSKFDLEEGLNEVACVAKKEGLKGEALTAKVVDTVLTQMFGTDFLSRPDAAALRETLALFLAQDEHLSNKTNNLISRLGNKS